MGSRLHHKLKNVNLSAMHKTFKGKVAGIQNFITRGRPLLVGGDAAGDFEMLNLAENRLWIARLDKPSKQEAVAKQIQNDQEGNWLIQPTISGAPVGFVPNSCELTKRLDAHGNTEVDANVKESVATLESTGQLKDFNNC